MAKTYTRKEDDDGVLRDGEFIRRPLMLMDQQSMFDHAKRVFATDSPTTDARVPLTDEQKSERIDRANAKLSDAWRNPTPALPVKDARQELPRSGTVDMASIYDTHDKRLQDAWRS